MSSQSVTSLAAGSPPVVWNMSHSHFRLRTQCSTNSGPSRRVSLSSSPSASAAERIVVGSRGT